MRMRLYDAQFVRSDGLCTAHIVAPDAETANQFAVEYHVQIGVELSRIALLRVDRDLPLEHRVGLDDMLESAPVGFATRCDPVGWFVFMTLHPTLKYYRIDDGVGGVTHIIAPDADAASAIWLSSIELDEDGCHPTCVITTSMDSLEERQREGLAALLEFGPAGVIAWDDERGWSGI